MVRTPICLTAALSLLATLAAGDPGPVGGEFQVNAQTAGNQRLPSVASAAAGAFVVVWSQPSGIFGRRFDAAGAPIGGDFAVSTSPVDAYTAPVVSSTPTGEFVVVWESAPGADGSDRAIFARRFDSAGVALGGELQVNTYTTGIQHQPDVAMHSSGAFVVVWASPDSSYTDGVFGRRFDAAGSPLGAEFQVNLYTTSTQYTPAVGVQATGGFIVVWTDAIGYPDWPIIKARRYDAGGTPLAGEEKVTTKPSSQAYGEVLPSIAVRGSGEFVVTWRDQPFPSGTPTRAKARRFDAAGVPLTGDLWLSSRAVDAGRAFEAAWTPSGEFLVVWTSEWDGSHDFDGDGDADGVRAQRVDAAGVSLAPYGFLVNTYTPDYESAPSVAADATGRLVVVWMQRVFPGNEAQGQDGDGGGIFGQRYEASGAAVQAFHPISAGGITLKDPGPTDRRSMGFRSADAGVGNGLNPEVNPTINGAVLHVYNSNGGGDSTCYSLPASGWTGSGTDDPLYVYRDRDFVNGPCNTARIRRNKFVRVNCLAKVQGISYTLDELAQGSVGAALTVGPVTYCAQLGGTVVRDAPGSFKARLAPAPGACPPPPTSCP